MLPTNNSCDTISEFQQLHNVFITATQLHSMMQEGVTILDARMEPDPEFGQSITDPGYEGNIRGSYLTRWVEFLQDEDKEDLKPAEELAALFRERGVSNDRPVGVFARWNSAFGEEGRIYWQLRFLGHTQVYILYRGIFAWLESGLSGTGYQGTGNFVACSTPSNIIMYQKELLDRIQQNEKFVLVDTRTEEEYNGATPCQCPRGGHLRTAVSFHWEEVFQTDGSRNLLPTEQLMKKLEVAGLKKDSSIVVYCTRGIRSSFAFAVLFALGFTSVLNYTGSFRQWSYAFDFPIETTTN